jgi:hypothetical protein
MPQMAGSFWYWGSDFGPIWVRELDSTRMNWAAGSQQMAMVSNLIRERERREERKREERRMMERGEKVLLVRI